MRSSSDELAVACRDLRGVLDRGGEVALFLGGARATIAPGDADGGGASAAAASSSSASCARSFHRVVSVSSSCSSVATRWERVEDGAWAARGGDGGGPCDMDGAARGAPGGTRPKRRGAPGPRVIARNKLHRCIHGNEMIMDRRTDRGGHPWKRHDYDGSDDRPRSASAMPVCVVSMLRRCLLFDGCVCYLFGENGNVLKYGNPSMACGDWRTVSSTTLNSCWTASAHKRSSNAGATISSCCNQQLDRVRPRKGSSSTIPHLLPSSRARRMWT